MEEILKVKQEVELSLLKKANVSSVGIGFKKVNNTSTGELAIIVGVSKKVPAAQLLARDLVPQSIGGHAVDVVQIGEIKPLTIDPTKKHRPIFPGISIGHTSVTAGSLGAIAYRDEKPVILSNCHVLANSGNAAIGDIVVQPGVYDGGSSTDAVGTLLDFVPIQMGSMPTDPGCGVMSFITKIINFLAATFGRKHRLSVINSEALFNEVDAAVSTVDVEYNPSIAEIGSPTGLADPALGVSVQKFGRTTLLTTGTIDQVNVTVSVGYGAGQLALFSNQILMGPMSAGGDSGSSILDTNKNLVALLFAGSDQVTIASPMKRVFELLKLNLPS